MKKFFLLNIQFINFLELLMVGVLICLSSCSIFKSQKVELEGKLLASDWKIPIKAELKWLSDGVCIGKTISDTNGVLNFRVDRKTVGVENALIVSPIKKMTPKKDTTLAPPYTFIAVYCVEVDTIPFNKSLENEMFFFYTKFQKMYGSSSRSH